jgi:hypothetical protein
MTGKWNFIAGSHGCLIDRYGEYYNCYTILKYPFNKGSSDVTINNNLIGEEEIFLCPIMRPIICAVIRLVIVWHLCAGLLYSIPIDSLNHYTKKPRINTRYYVRLLRIIGA